MALSKLIQRRIYTFLSSKWGMVVLVVGAIVTLNSLFQLVYLILSSTATNIGGQQVPLPPAPSGVLLEDAPWPTIDIVYTWVNGSDPLMAHELRKVKLDAGLLTCNATSREGCDDSSVATSSRFEDNEEMRYSLRSIERFAPWARHVFIVTNGQIPSWLDLSNPRLTLVTHEEIFANKSHLPTFSSPAIEAHLHRIPLLSEFFLYLNDDVMLGRPVYPDDFYTHSQGQKVFLSWPVPNCNEGCPSNWIGDGYCDVACNVTDCSFDGGDCANATAATGQGSWWSRYNSGWASGSPSGWGADRSTKYCSRACPDTWVGDKYCDNACKNAECGFDAGDCGVEIIYSDLYGIEISEPGGSFDIPLGTSAMYFNLSGIIGNNTITDGSHDNGELVRTATISQKHKVMVLTFHRDQPHQQVLLSVTYSNGTDIEISWNITLATLVRSSNATTNGTITGDAASNSTAALATNSTAPPVAGDAGDNSTTEIEQPANEPPSANEQPDGEEEQEKEQEEQEQEHEAEAKVNRGLFGSGPPRRGLLYLARDRELGDWDRALNSTEQQHDGEEQLSEDQQLVLPAEDGDGIPIDQGELQLLAKSEPMLDMHQLIALYKHKKRQGNQQDFWPWQQENTNVVVERKQPSSPRGRRLLDMFGSSLKHVDALFNKQFGHAARKVPAHMPHMINKRIMKDLQAMFPAEFDKTSANKLRSRDDMQYSFSYFYFLIHQKVNITAEEAFADFDVDGDGQLIANELRTLAIRVYGHPLEGEKYRSMVEQLFSNSNESKVLDFVAFNKTTEVVKDVLKFYRDKAKNKHEILGTDDVAFLMINENDTNIESRLDGIRLRQQKFICLNDNMNHSNPKAKEAVRYLHQFYMSLFPLPSSFELPDGTKNRFLHIHELREYQEELRHRKIAFFIVAGLVVFAFLMYTRGNESSKVQQSKRRQQKEERYQKLMSV